MKKLSKSVSHHAKRAGDLQSEEGESLGSMLNRYLHTKGGVEVDVAVVVTLGGEDEGRQPSAIVSMAIYYIIGGGQVAYR